MSNKLERAIDRVTKVSAGTPALYCSRTELIDKAATKAIGMSPLFVREPSFRNALVQNIGGGNTMVFNGAAKALLEETSAKVVSHDWWAYQIVTGAGGIAIYDPVPTVRYRQHDRNALGSNLNLRAQLQRLQMLADGRFRSWNDINLHALKSMAHLLTTESLGVMAAFEAARDSRPVRSLKFMKKSGVYRQTKLGSLALFSSAIMKRI